LSNEIGHLVSNDKKNGGGCSSVAILKLVLGSLFWDVGFRDLAFACPISKSNCSVHVWLGDAGVELFNLIFEFNVGYFALCQERVIRIWGQISDFNEYFSLFSM